MFYKRIDIYHHDADKEFKELVIDTLRIIRKQLTYISSKLDGASSSELKSLTDQLNESSSKLDQAVKDNTPSL